MDSPAEAAQRLLMGTGLGLLLVSGLAFQSEMLSLDSASVGWAIPISAIVCILLAFSGRKETGGLLGGLFSAEDEGAVAERIGSEISAEEKDASVGGAWAELEANLLSDEIGEDE